MRREGPTFRDVRSVCRAVDEDKTNILNQIDMRISLKHAKDRRTSGRKDKTSLNEIISSRA